MTTFVKESPGSGIYVFFGNEPSQEVSNWAKAQSLFEEAVINKIAINVMEGSSTESGRIVGVEVWRYNPR